MTIKTGQSSSSVGDVRNTLGKIIQDPAQSNSSVGDVKYTFKKTSKIQSQQLIVGDVRDTF